MKGEKIQLYPLRFKELFKEKPWGGDGLKKLLQKPCNGTVGESWEIADLAKESSVIVNGPYQGKPLSWLVQQSPREILGEDVYIRHQRLPLMIKFLWAQDRLSLQVHPTDDFARAYEKDGSNGKMEAWYVVSASPEARVIRGVLPGTTEGEFREYLASGKVEECVNRLRVKEGDVIFIPPGTVHSAYGGVLLYELQQSSDLTYRFCDWGRAPDHQGRKVDVERAIRAMDLQSIGVSKLKPTRLSGYAYRRKLMIKCEKFTMEMIELQGARKVKERSDPQRFRVFTVLDGSGKFLYGEKRKSSVTFERGQTFLFPAALGEFEIQARKACQILVATT
jgi:mannose-6-phosphate isomerase